MHRRPAIYDETRFPVLFAFTLFLLGMASAAGLETLKARLHPAAILLLCLGGMGVLAFGSSTVFRKWARAHWRPRALTVVQIYEPQRPAKALVVMVSKGIGESSARDAVLAHSDRLEHLRLVTTNEGKDCAAGVEEYARKVCARLKDVQTKLLSDIKSIPEAKKLVSSIRAELLKQVSEDELVCDFTGLNKQASAGMVLACAQKGPRLEYMVAPQQTSDLRADPSGGHSTPMEVEIAYQVEEQT